MGHVRWVLKGMVLQGFDVLVGLAVTIEDGRKLINDARGYELMGFSKALAPSQRVIHYST